MSLQITNVKPRMKACFVDNILYESSDAVTMAMKGKQGQNADEANLYFVLENDNLYSPPPPFDSHLEEDSDAGPSGHQYEDIDSTRKLVEGGARCSTPIYAMPDELSKTTDSRMNAMGQRKPIGYYKGCQRHFISKYGFRVYCRYGSTLCSNRLICC